MGTLKWVFNTSGPVLSSPAIAEDGTIYVASDDAFFYAIWPNGTEKWSIPIANFTHSSPSIAPNGTVYLATGDQLYAISPDGTIEWKYSFGGNRSIYSSPTVGRDGTIYIGYQDHEIYAINSDGTLKWNYTTGLYVLSTAAIAVDGTIYIGSYDNRLYALYPNGTLKWNHKTSGLVLSSPAIGSDGTIYVGSGYNNGFYAFYPNGTLRWGFHIFTDGNFVSSSPAIGVDGTLYVGARDHHLYAIHPDGVVKWKFKTGGWVTSSPALGSDGSIYFGSRDNSVYAVYPNGSLKWEYETGGWVYSSPAIGADGTVYVGSDDGNLYAFGQQVQGPVADANGPYIGDEGSLIILDGSGSYDPDGDALQYRWDFDNDGAWDTSWSSTPTVAHTWFDDHKGSVALEVKENVSGNVEDVVSDGDVVGTSWISFNWGQAQSFLPGLEVMTEVDVDITISYVKDTPNAPICLHIRKTLNSTDLTSVCLPPEQIPRKPPGESAWVKFDIPDITVTPNLVYFLVLTSSTKPYVYETHLNREVYPSGALYFNDTGEWKENLIIDLRFKTYGSRAALSSIAYSEVTIKNVPPTADAGGPYESFEGMTIEFMGNHIDPGLMDTHTYEWDFDYDGITFDAEATGQFVSHTYIDDFDGEVALRVTDDDGGIGIDSAHILVRNVPPTIELEVLPMEVIAFLRIAGEKWHDVTMELYEEGVLVAEGSLVRYPGSPNDQMLNLAHLDVDISKNYSANVRYTPEDDPVNGQPNGANPCWIILRFDDGEELWLHHTFNVQHEETYVWEVDLTQTLMMHGITFKATAYDPGADDLTFYWDFGDGTNATSFYPNTNGSYPVVITETVTHFFSGSGTYNVTVTVEDDDGGKGTATFTIYIP